MGGNALPEIHVGVLLEESAGPPQGGGPAGHTEARGYRGDHVGGHDSRVTKLGQDILQATARAVGAEVAAVLAGVVAGIESSVPMAPRANGGTGALVIESLELNFGIKATLGVGPAVTALLTAAGEATVDVKVTLSNTRANPPG
jgi:hypothetical protein